MLPTPTTHSTTSLGFRVFSTPRPPIKGEPLSCPELSLGCPGFANFKQNKMKEKGEPLKLGGPQGVLYKKCYWRTTFWGLSWAVLGWSGPFWLGLGAQPKRMALRARGWKMGGKGENP